MNGRTGNLHASRERLAAFAELPDDEPVVMVNLLRFRADGGEDAYNEYGRKMFPLMEKHGLKVVYAGRCEQLLIGAEEWDRVLLVEYPSRAAFLRMVTSEEYQTISQTRTDALVDSVLYATRPLGR